MGFCTLSQVSLPLSFECPNAPPPLPPNGCIHIRALLESKAGKEFDFLFTLRLREKFVLLYTPSTTGICLRPNAHLCVEKHRNNKHISYFLLEPWHVSNCNSTDLVGIIAIIQLILWEQLLFTYFLVDNQQLIHTCSVTYRTSKSIGESGTSKSNFSSSMRLDTPPIALGNATKAEFWIQTVCRNGSRHCQRQLNVILRSWKISLIMTDLLKRRNQGFYSMIMKTYQL